VVDAVDESHGNLNTGVLQPLGEGKVVVAKHVGCCDD